MKPTTKATVIVRLKSEVLDPQGDAVRRALGTLGFEGIRSVRIGKLIELELDQDVCDRQTAERNLRKMADAILVNPVIEDFEVRW